jgi:hypothetical protein
MINVYCTYDNKTESYNQPMFYLEEEACVKALSYFINSEEGLNEVNPVDYELFHLGKYDPQTGKFELLEAPKHLMNLRKLKGDENGKNA